MNGKIDFRGRAKNHFKLALSIIAANDIEQALFAALRLRMAIECLAYEILQSYEPEIVSEVGSWQPHKLIKELSNIDPRCGVSKILSFKDPDTGEMIELGEYTSFDSLNISKIYNKLGSMLHEPTLISWTKSGSKSESEILDECKSIADQVQKIIQSPLFSFNYRENVIYHCLCGFSISRRKGFLQTNPRLPCPKCNTDYIVEQVGEDFTFNRIIYQFECPECKNPIDVNSKELTEGHSITCTNCTTTLILNRDWIIKRK